MLRNLGGHLEFEFELDKLPLPVVRLLDGAQSNQSSSLSQSQHNEQSIDAYVAFCLHLSESKSGYCELMNATAREISKQQAVNSV